MSPGTSALAAAPGAAGSRAVGRQLPVVRVLALLELRRTLRTPLPWVGIGLAVLLLWDITAGSGWEDARYHGMAQASVPLIWAISSAAALVFHRARLPVASDAPVAENLRTIARLAAMVPLVACAAGFAVLIAWLQRDLGGLPLGAEPGPTVMGLHSTAELSQHVALAVLGVALGAALGLRMARLATVLPLLLVVWYVAGIFYWFFSHPDAVPFAIFQVQPVTVPIGPADADPATFPAHWLLEPPSDHQTWWARQFVSASLAWWHIGWLLGLAQLLLATVFRTGAVRLTLLAGGALLATVSIVAQLQVIP